MPAVAVARVSGLISLEMNFDTWHTPCIDFEITFYSVSSTLSTANFWGGGSSVFAGGFSFFSGGESPAFDLLSSALFANPSPVNTMPPISSRFIVFPLWVI